MRSGPLVLAVAVAAVALRSAPAATPSRTPPRVEPVVTAPAGVKLERVLGASTLRHGEVIRLEFSRDGELLATAGGGRLAIWETGTGREVRRTSCSYRFALAPGG